METFSIAERYARSTYLPPFDVTLPMQVPQFTSRRSFYKPYGRVLGGLGFSEVTGMIRSRPPIVARADPTIGIMDRISMGLGATMVEYQRPTYYRPWTSLRPSAGPLLGLGQEVFRADVEWWAKAAGTAMLVFGGLFVLAKL